MSTPGAAVRLTYREAVRQGLREALHGQLPFA